MGLNDLVLSPQVLSALYPNTLVEPEPGAAPLNPVITEPVEKIVEKPVEAAAPSYKSLGDNRKNILVVVRYADAVHLPDEALTFLTNLLKACKLSLGDVSIFNLNNYPDANYRDVTHHYSSRIVFLFGVEPVAFGLPLNFPEYQVQTFANTTYLFSPSLELLQNDPLLKSKLWVSLRHMFGI